MASHATPSVLWAERKDKLFVTIEVQDVQEPKVKVEDSGHLTFSGSSDGKVYSLELQLHGAVSGTDAKVAVLPRHVIIVLPKAQAGPHWGKLLAGAGKAPHFVKVDWSKYKDEDEEDQEADPMAGLDLSQLEGLKNFGGSDSFGDGDDDEDDDDDMPSLAPQR